MADTFTTNVRARKIETGTRTGTWGSAANADIFDVFDQALGYGSVTLTGTTQTITISDGTASTAGSMAVVFDGTPGGTTTVTISPATLKKVWIFQNSTTDGSTVEISQGSGSNVSIPNGYSAIVYSDGGGASANVYNVLESVAFTNIQGTLDTAAQASIDHDQLDNFVADEHVDHTAVTLTAGVALSGGGDISANRTFNVDPTGLTLEATVDGANDYVMMYDASEGALNRVLVDDLVSGGGAGSVSSVAAGEGLANDGSASAVDLSIALEEISTAALTGSDFMVAVTGAGAHKKQALTNVDVGLFNDDGTYLTAAVESIDAGTVGDGVNLGFSGTGSGPYTGAVTVNLSLSINDLTGLAAGSISGNDLLLIADVSASNAHRNVTVEQLSEAMIVSATSSSGVVGADQILLRDTSAGDVRKETLSSIGLSVFNDDLGLTPGNFTQHTGASLAFFSGTAVSQQSTPSSLSLLSTGDVTTDANFSDVQTAVNALISVLSAYDLTA